MVDIEGLGLAPSEQVLRVYLDACEQIPYFDCAGFEGITDNGALLHADGVGIHPQATVAEAHAKQCRCVLFNTC